MFFPEASGFLASPLLHPDPSLQITGASIDTRTLQKGDLFAALPGAKVDGHTFLNTAFEKGASCALVSEGFVRQNQLPASWKNLMPVKDPAEAFLKLSAHYRNQFSLKASIGVVGSVGKTSTKEFLAYLLRQKFETLFTQGNLNNHLGLPLTLFGLKKQHEVCLCELGTNRLGDVRQLAQVLQPTQGLLTRMAPEHLEGFGTLDRVYEGEVELFECLRPGSYAVIPDDDPMLETKITRFPLKWIRVGYTDKADYRVTQTLSRDGMVHFKLNGNSFAFPGMASFLARNAAMAAAMAELCGFKMQDMPKVWEGFKLPNGRFQPQELPGGARIIFDGYNASPVSFEAALKSFEEIAADGRKILVFSDMLELGDLEKKYHEDLGAQISALGIDRVLAYGKRAAWSLETLKRRNPGMAAEHVANAQQAADRLRGSLQKGDWVLLKGSRSMRVEDVIQYLSGSPAVNAH